MRNTAAVLVMALLCGALGALFFVPAHSDSPYVREDIRIPVPDGHYSIALTILRPRGDGPFGALVLNHGVGEDERERFLESPALLAQAASAFVARGYAVIMPLRRGFGETGGPFAEDAASAAVRTTGAASVQRPGTCSRPTNSRASCRTSIRTG